jgi:hypothetical protein
MKDLITNSDKVTESSLEIADSQGKGQMRVGPYPLFLLKGGKYHEYSGVARILSSPAVTTSRSPLTI